MPSKIAGLQLSQSCRSKLGNGRSLVSAVLLCASLGFCSGLAAAAEESWQYVLVNPDGTQAAGSQIDLSYPPVSDAGPRPHLIIIEPEGGMPEPMILNIKTKGAAAAPPPEAAPAAAEPKRPAEQAAVVVPPVRRAFKLF